MTRKFDIHFIITVVVCLIIFISSGITGCNDSNGSGLLFIDPLFENQWHLNNTGQGGGTAGMDVNVVPVWNDNNFGSGVLIAIVDDGIEFTHEDLVSNNIATLNYNYINGSNLLNPGQHGTSVTGVAAAVQKNDRGGRGVAPGANFTGFNLLIDFTTANEIDAMTRSPNSVHISNNSWGPMDLTGQLFPSPTTWKTSIDDGVTLGRGGKGIIYVWAAGNGGRISPFDPTEYDNSNYDGYANYYGVIAIGALGDDGKRAFYSERGSNIWVSTYSNGGMSGITTTDLSGVFGYDSTGNYTDSFGGTSSAAPLASGIIALMLSANPNLSWRDVKLILAETSVMIDPFDSEWTVNSAGYNINYKYGFGSMDAEAAVARSKTWINAGPMVTSIPFTSNVNEPIPDDGTVVNDIINVTGSGITYIEHIAIIIIITHQDAGDLEITLTSPSGTKSVLAEFHNCTNGSTLATIPCTWYNGGNFFEFGTVRSLGEQADGNWDLTIKDLDPGNTGTRSNWSLIFYGR